MNQAGKSASHLLSIAAKHAGGQYRTVRRPLVDWRRPHLPRLQPLPPKLSSNHFKI